MTVDPFLNSHFNNIWQHIAMGTRDLADTYAQTIKALGLRTDQENVNITVWALIFKRVLIFMEFVVSFIHKN